MPKPKRQKLSTWDLAMLEKLVECALKGNTVTFERMIANEHTGVAYGNSLRDLHDRLLRATKGSLTES